MEATPDVPLNWPAPLAPPGPLRGFITLVQVSCGQMLFRRRTLLVGLVALLPVPLALALTLAHRQLSLPGLSSPAGFYQLLFTFFYAHVLLLLVSLLYGTGLISDEVESRTLTCLLTRPVSKTVVLLAKLVAYWVVAALLCGPSLVACFAVLQAGTAPLAELLGSLIQDLTVLGAGLAVYGVVFTFFGLALKRSLLIGLLYCVWESIFAYVPGFFHRMTVLHHLQAVSRLSSEYAWILAAVGERTSSLDATLTLAIVFILVLGAAVVVFHRREYREQGGETA